MTQKVNLLDYNQAQLGALLSSWGEAPYRAQQILQWVHQRGKTDFEQMSNLSKALKNTLLEKAEIALPTIDSVQQASDGTRKWLLRLHCGNSIETVYIPETSRGTLCVPSQVGCALNCSFCSTAKQGFNRNLSTGEIIGQLWIAVRELSSQQGQHDKKITNVVMMGMGEPLLNFDAVVAAMDLMMDDLAYGLSKYRVTLSTSGVVPELMRLREASPAALAVSLHAPNDALRDQLVPINKKYPLKVLMDLCKSYFQNEPRRKITFEYVMLRGINDSLAHAKELVRLLKDVPAKLNLIPFNPFPMTEYQCSTKESIQNFQKYLISHKIHTTTRKTRGEDIDAACGQLAGAVKDRTRRAAQWQKIHFKSPQVQDSVVP